jgi:hypothetical protein
MNKVVVIFNGAIVSVPAVESDIVNGQTKLVPLVPADWVEVTAINAAYPTFQGKTKPPVIKQSKQDDLIESMQALTAAITAQTNAISQLVNSNLDIVDQMMATEDEQQDGSSLYLDGSGEL